MNDINSYVKNNTIDIPHDFVKYYLQNYENRQDSIQSDKIYDWFGKMKFETYQQFQKQIEEHLELNTEYWLVLQQGDDIIYLVSQLAIKQLLAICGKQPLKYFVQLDNLVMQFLKQELEISKQQHENNRRVGYIYGFKHKAYNTIDYVGSTKKLLKQRKNTHVKTMLDSQKLPFYRLLVAQMFQNYDMILIERVQYFDESELLAREYFHQEYYKSYQTNSFSCKKCNKHYQMPTQFEKHRQKCYQQEQILSTSSSDQEQE